MAVSSKSKPASKVAGGSRASQPDSQQSPAMSVDEQDIEVDEIEADEAEFDDDDENDRSSNAKDKGPTSKGSDAKVDDNAQHDHEFEASGDSGASLTYPMQCSALRKNGHVVMKGRPCKVIDMSTSKTGKHGHAKVNYTGIDIFTGRKYEDMSPSTHNVDVPNITRAEFVLIDIADGFLSLMDDTGEMKEDVKVPEGELGDKLNEDFEGGKELLVTILRAMGEEAAISFKEAPKGN
ncbi:translation initiation factor eIF5A [Coemansia sp. RSA 2322]|nr:translation initiation factor eIF5A [Coemansia sp. RSA 2322]